MVAQVRAPPPKISKLLRCGDSGENMVYGNEDKPWWGCIYIPAGRPGTYRTMLYPSLRATQGESRCFWSVPRGSVVNVADMMSKGCRPIKSDLHP